MKGLSKMRSMTATLLLFAVVAFTLPLSVSAKSPPGQAIHKQTLKKIDLQRNVVAVTNDTPVAEVNAVLKLSYTAMFECYATPRPRNDGRQVASRHELTKYSTSIECFGLRPVLLL